MGLGMAGLSGAGNGRAWWGLVMAGLSGAGNGRAWWGWEWQVY